MMRHHYRYLVTTLILLFSWTNFALIQQVSARESKITALSPLGKPPAIHVHAMAPRLDTLKGKTIYIVDDGYVGGDVLLNEIITWFGQNMPEVKAVYRRKAGGFPDPDPKLWAEIRENGDAMIMGMGH